MWCADGENYGWTFVVSMEGLENMSNWPQMRHDRRNTGATSQRAQYAGDRPWSFRTGRGIFTTPVLGPDGAIYFGSADGIFYALEGDGELRWSFQSAGIIDSAALVSGANVTVGSGDGYLYSFATTPDLGPGLARLRWRYAAEPPDGCLLYTSPSPRDGLLSRMPSSA